jgi:hypothetical protein
MNEQTNAIMAVMEEIKKENPAVFRALEGAVGNFTNQMTANSGVVEKVKKAPPTTIFEIVKERRQKVGIMLGTIKDGKILIGWSKANLKVGDRFNKNEGMSLAEARAIKLSPAPKLPLCMRRKMINFETRCLRYFKDATAIEIMR